MKNQGISLISLIITIIVIIILAAIVIFTGLGTPDSANFAKFCSSVDDVQMAVLDVYSDLRVAHAISGDTRNDEQLYKEVATGADSAQDAAMDNNASATDGVCQNLKGSGDKYIIGNLKLPLVKESEKEWYVTENGRVFNAKGYDYDGKTYFNASLYTEPATGDTTTTPATIAQAILDGNKTL